MQATLIRGESVTLDSAVGHPEIRISTVGWKDGSDPERFTYGHPGCGYCQGNGLGRTMNCIIKMRPWL